MWAFGFLFFMFGVGGGANLLFPAVGIVAERFVFTGSFGLIFLAVYYGFQLFEKNKKQKSKFAFYGIGGLLVILSFSQVTARNKDWNSRFSLYKNDIKNLSNSAKAHSLLGTEYTAKADFMFREHLGHPLRLMLLTLILMIVTLIPLSWNLRTGVLRYMHGYHQCVRIMQEHLNIF